MFSAHDTCRADQEGSEYDQQSQWAGLSRMAASWQLDILLQRANELRGTVTLIGLLQPALHRGRMSAGWHIVHLLFTLGNLPK